MGKLGYHTKTTTVYSLLVLTVSFSIRRYTVLQTSLEGNSIMRNLRTPVLILFICVVTVVHQSRAGKCADGSKSAPNSELQTCCWYAQDSCCHSEGLSETMRNIDAAAALLTTYGLSTFTECFESFVDLLCSVCNPDTDEFLDASKSTTTFRVCLSFCDQLYESCKNQVLPFIADSGYGICEAMSSATSGIDGFKFEVDSSNNNCFRGVGTGTIQKNDCLPSISDESEASSDAGSTTSRSRTTQNYFDHWVIKVSLIGIGILVVFVTGILILYFIKIKKKNRTTSNYALQADEDVFSIPNSALSDDEGDDNQLLGDESQEPVDDDGF